MPTTPLSVLDLAPVSDGAEPAQALRNTIDLARHAERLGYHRYWVAEHHFTPGVASSSPAVLTALIASATSRIRVGSGAVLAGNTTAAAVLEQFATIDAVHPGRIDLGLGRTGQRRAEALATVAAGAPPKPARQERVVDGLLLPAPFDVTRQLTSSRARTADRLLRQDGAQSPPFAEQVADIEAFIAGSYRTEDGEPVELVPGRGATLELWLLGSSGGESAQLAGARGLPFAANYHVAPSAVLEAVQAYRDAFVPSSRLDRPYVVVSADVVVAESDERARELASPYAAWVRSIRNGTGAIPYPSPQQAAAQAWSDEDRALVDDRVRTQFVGSPQRVAEQLRTLQAATGADELLVTSVTHDHRDRVRSHELLATAWAA
ncbi:MsnO8 family LLM class oxidoreductase [Cumulibacter manganitolerans]|uniref:MsnO8 family LLM class oxidoreductase n=1 Tax=Cumulibacter manganitolerans TaxID=1884992 RepID=UPI0012968ECD|nr:MsnO8 family LLM class oxidoreductase [Cumulibacter manganitolerans]